MRSGIVGFVGASPDTYSRVRLDPAIGRAAPYPNYPTSYPYAATIAGDERRQPATRVCTNWSLKRRNATADDRMKRTPKPQVAGSIPVPPAKPLHFRVSASIHGTNLGLDGSA